MTGLDMLFHPALADLLFVSYAEPQHFPVTVANTNHPVPQPELAGYVDQPFAKPKPHGYYGNVYPYPPDAAQSLNYSSYVFDLRSIEPWQCRSYGYGPTVNGSLANMWSMAYMKFAVIIPLEALSAVRTITPAPVLVSCFQTDATSL